MSKPAQLIPPDAYPQMMPKSAMPKLAKELRAAETIARGGRVIAANVNILRDAILDYVDELEAGQRDHAVVLDKAHEIKGFAETAGMLATGRIADGLCRYFDESDQLGVGPDAAIVRLHVSAIARAARAEDEAGQMSLTVANELTALVNHKLAEIKNSA